MRKGGKRGAPLVTAGLAKGLLGKLPAPLTSTITIYPTPTGLIAPEETPNLPSLTD